MKRLFFSLLLSTFTTLTLNAECELDETPRQLAYQQYLDAETLYEDSQFYDAYNMLIQSLQTYSSQEDTIQLSFSCVNYVPGPYAPIISRSSKTEIYAFERVLLGKDIKRQLSPAPYAFIEFQKNATIVSVVNAPKISRNKQMKRLPLEGFSLLIDGEAFNFEKINSGERKTVSSTKVFTLNSSISTHEAFDFKLYK